jgi:hypothetical protein
MQGTYITDGTFLLGKAQTVADALERARKPLCGVNGTNVGRKRIVMIRGCAETADRSAFMKERSKSGMKMNG